MTPARPTDYPPVIPGAREEVYKTADDVALKLWIFTPETHSEHDRRPAIVFFFGGGWYNGNPSQFIHHCEYLIERGIIAIIADYRVRERHEKTVRECVADAKSAIRWIREHATHEGIDPDRIVASGGSSGGHLAAATATLPEHDESSENLTIRSIPNALVLFNPAVITAPVPEHPGLAKWLKGDLSWLGADPDSLSPYHNVDKHVAPTIIFHGMADDVVPYKDVELFREKMDQCSNRCELIGYNGAPHGFFNYGLNNNALFIDTVNKMDSFLVSLGYLQGPPETIHHR